MAGPAGDWPEAAAATSVRSALGGYRAYARRWVFLLVISLLSCSNATVGAGPGTGGGAGLRVEKFDGDKLGMLLLEKKLERSQCE